MRIARACCILKERAGQCIEPQPAETLAPKPSTLAPKPSTLIPKPETVLTSASSLNPPASRAVTAPTDRLGSRTTSACPVTCLYRVSPFGFPFALSRTFSFSDHRAALLSPSAHSLCPQLTSLALPVAS